MTFFAFKILTPQNFSPLQFFNFGHLMVILLFQDWRGWMLYEHGLSYWNKISFFSYQKISLFCSPLQNSDPHRPPPAKFSSDLEEILNVFIIYVYTFYCFKFINFFWGILFFQSFRRCYLFMKKSFSNGWETSQFH